MSDYVPHELLLDIFSRLPVKSLLRFRSVSKRWRSIISSPNFINTHFTNSSKSPSLLLSRISNDWSHIEHFTLHSNDRSLVDYVKIEHPLKIRKEPIIVGSCNGLICLTHTEICTFTLLWNPSIRRYLSLHFPRFIIHCFRSYIAFGFDSKSKDYKVLRITYLYDLHKSPTVLYPESHVYALSIGRWESVSSTFPCTGFNCLSQEQVYVNGACLRIIFNSSPENGPMILSFDLGAEVFQLMDTPAEISGNRSFSGLEIRLLHNMVSVSRVEEEGSVSIWVMREFGVAESWTKQYSFNFEADLRDFYEREWFYDCCYVESLALLNGSRLNGEAPPRLADVVLPTWLLKRCSGEGPDSVAIESVLISVTSVRGNLVDFLLTAC